MKEVSNGIYAVDSQLIRYFKGRNVKEIHKGTPLENNILYEQYETEYDMWEASINLIHNMRFVYMMALLESFFEEYLQERQVTEDDQKDIKKQWKKEIKKNPSTSKLNLEYMAFAMKNLLNIDLKLDEVGEELGALRCCIVHTTGIVNEKDIVLLTNTLSELGLEKQVGVKIILDKSMIGNLLGKICGIVLSCDSN